MTINTRVQILSDRATVRYVGPVQGYNGEWIGVEWDDVTRGKHDGSVNGVRYFTCQHPTGGSFVRKEKVHFGVTLPEALQLRYNDVLGEGRVDVGEEGMYVQTVSHRLRKVDFEGRAKVTEHQKQLHLLNAARLRGMAVANAGEPGSLSSLAPNLVSLDLTGNLLSQWRTVQDIVLQLPNLQELHISDNFFTVDGPHLAAGDDDTNGPVQKEDGELIQEKADVELPLKYLVMNKCRVTWGQILALSRKLPQLEGLHLAGNALCTLTPPSGLTALSHLSNLKVLDLEDNGLTSWDEVLTLSSLPQLQHLHLGNNPLPSISYSPGSCSNPSGPFPVLEALYLGGCKISSWSSVDELDKFPQLKTLRLSANPLLDGYKGGGRFEVIARIGGLTMLNGSAIRERERRDAEVQYLQMVLPELEDVSSSLDINIDHLVKDHPRLKLLKDKFGRVTSAGASTNQKPVTLGATTVQLRLTVLQEEDAQPPAKVVNKKLPRSATLANLKLMCEKLFKVKVEWQELYYKNPEQDGIESMGSNDSQQLLDFDIKDGAEVMVKGVDPAMKREQQDADRQEARRNQEEKISQMLQRIEMLQAGALR